MPTVNYLTKYMIIMLINILGKNVPICGSFVVNMPNHSIESCNIDHISKTDIIELYNKFEDKQQFKWMFNNLIQYIGMCDVRYDGVKFMYRHVELTTDMMSSGTYYIIILTLAILSKKIFYTEMTSLHQNCRAPLVNILDLIPIKYYGVINICNFATKPDNYLDITNNKFEFKP